MITVKTQTLVDDFDYILKSDPALDLTSSDFDERWRIYEDGHGEPPLKPGGEPTIFKLRHLRGRHIRKLSPYLHKAHKRPEYSIEAAWAVVAVALRSVENLKDEFGKNVKLKTESDDDGENIVSAESLELLGLETVSELSAAVLNRSFSNPL